MVRPYSIWKEVGLSVIKEIVELVEDLVRVIEERVGFTGFWVVLGREQEVLEPPFAPWQDQRYWVVESGVSEREPWVQRLRVVEQEPETGAVVFGKEQETVAPPSEPRQDQRECVELSAVSEKVPVVQRFTVVEQEPFAGRTAGIVGWPL